MDKAKFRYVSEVWHTVLVARGLTQECLLGADHLLKQRCVVDLERRVLCAGSSAVSFISEN